PMWYGNKESDFSKYANLADRSLEKMAVFGGHCRPTKLTVYNDTIPKIMSVNDKTMLTANVGKYQPNPFGLYDMHGNVSEWTRSDYDSNRNQTNQARKAVRGGSWRDRPYRATSSYRLPYEAWQRVFNVGFRVVIEE
ncbi:MAG: SUMF1/EgtB/PvdO family nonheme iron enzyme, partial [Lentisphaeria bacterium]|nr:SUMF1/EgtB/PvdO family nonheme iron enzyme [Lentisphaeria bacterium]